MSAADRSSVLTTGTDATVTDPATNTSGPTTTTTSPETSAESEQTQKKVNAKGQQVTNVIKGVMGAVHGGGEAIRGFVNNGVDQIGEGVARGGTSKEFQNNRDAELAAKKDNSGVNAHIAKDGLDELKAGVSTVKTMGKQDVTKPSEGTSSTTTADPALDSTSTSAAKADILNESSTTTKTA